MSLAIVPIVLRRASVEESAPATAFIALDDFGGGPEQLAKYLKTLMQNTAEYRKYFDWKRHYDLHSMHQTDHWCKLCEAIVNGKHRIIPNITKWWIDDAACIADHVDNLLRQ